MPKSAKSVLPKPVSDEVVLPDKIYFRIGEVSRLCRLPSYVLRYWETEFPRLKPPKGSSGQRMYRKPDVEYVLRIKKLLYEEGFTVAGARQKLSMEAKDARKEEARKKEEKEAKKQQTIGGPIPGDLAVEGENLRQVRQDLEEILGMLSEKP